MSDRIDLFGYRDTEMATELEQSWARSRRWEGITRPSRGAALSRSTPDSGCPTSRCAPSHASCARRTAFAARAALRGDRTSGACSARVA